MVIVNNVVALVIHSVIEADALTLGSWYYHGGLALHNALPSLAGGEWPGRCDYYRDRRSVPPTLPNCTTCPGRSCPAAS